MERAGAHAGESLVGGIIKKLFDGAPFRGVVAGFDAKEGLYQIKYDDGDEEEMSEDEVNHYHVGGGGGSSSDDDGDDGAVARKIRSSIGREKGDGVQILVAATAAAARRRNCVHARLLYPPGDIHYVVFLAGENLPAVVEFVSKELKKMRACGSVGHASGFQLWHNRRLIAGFRARRPLRVLPSGKLLSLQVKLVVRLS